MAEPCKGDETVIISLLESLTTLSERQNEDSSSLVLKKISDILLFKQKCVQKGTSQIYNNYFGQLTVALCDILMKKQDSTIDFFRQLFQLWIQVTRSVPKETKLSAFKGNLTKFSKCAALMPSIGDSQTQLLLLELIIRYPFLPINETNLPLYRVTLNLFKGAEKFFLTFHSGLGTSMRKFLKMMNEKTNNMVLSFVAYNVSFNNESLYASKGSELWVNFNLASENIVLTYDANSLFDGLSSSITVDSIIERNQIENIFIKVLSQSVTIRLRLNSPPHTSDQKFQKRIRGVRDVSIILDNNTGSEKSQFNKILEALSKWRDPSEIDMEIDSDSNSSVESDSEVASNRTYLAKSPHEMNLQRKTIAALPDDEETYQKTYSQKNIFETNISVPETVHSESYSDDGSSPPAAVHIKIEEDDDDVQITENVFYESKSATSKMFTDIRVQTTTSLPRTEIAPTDFEKIEMNSINDQREHFRESNVYAVSKTPLRNHREKNANVKKSEVARSSRKNLPEPELTYQIYKPLMNENQHKNDIVPNTSLSSSRSKIDQPGNVIPIAATPNNSRKNVSKLSRQNLKESREDIPKISDNQCNDISTLSSSYKAKESNNDFRKQPASVNRARNVDVQQSSALSSSQIFRETFTAIQKPRSNQRDVKITPSKSSGEAIKEPDNCIPQPATPIRPAKTVNVKQSSTLSTLSSSQNSRDAIPKNSDNNQRYVTSTLSSGCKAKESDNDTRKQPASINRAKDVDVKQPSSLCSIQNIRETFTANQKPRIQRNVKSTPFLSSDKAIKEPNDGIPQPATPQSSALSSSQNLKDTRDTIPKISENQRNATSPFGSGLKAKEPSNDVRMQPALINRARNVDAKKLITAVQRPRENQRNVNSFPFLSSGKTIEESDKCIPQPTAPIHPVKNVDVKQSSALSSSQNMKKADVSSRSSNSVCDVVHKQPIPINQSINIDIEPSSPLNSGQNLKKTNDAIPKVTNIQKRINIKSPTAMSTREFFKESREEPISKSALPNYNRKNANAKAKNPTIQDKKVNTKDFVQKPDIPTKKALIPEPIEDVYDFPDYPIKPKPGPKSKKPKAAAKPRKPYQRKTTRAKALAERYTPLKTVDEMIASSDEPINKLPKKRQPTKRKLFNQSDSNRTLEQAKPDDMEDNGETKKKISRRDAVRPFGFYAEQSSQQSQLEETVTSLYFKNKENIPPEKFRAKINSNIEAINRAVPLSERRLRMFSSGTEHKQVMKCAPMPTAERISFSYRSSMVSTADNANVRGERNEGSEREPLQNITPVPKPKESIQRNTIDVVRGITPIQSHDQPQPNTPHQSQSQPQPNISQQSQRQQRTPHQKQQSQNQPIRNQKSTIWRPFHNSQNIHSQKAITTASQTYPIDSDFLEPPSHDGPLFDYTAIMNTLDHSIRTDDTTGRSPIRASFGRKTLGPDLDSEDDVILVEEDANYEPEDMDLEDDQANEFVRPSLPQVNARPNSLDMGNARISEEMKRISDSYFRELHALEDKLDTNYQEAKDIVAAFGARLRDFSRDIYRIIMP